ncbi:MAG: Lrp/AsnC family transcriptional regulator [Alphaproteobacteria bacterium]|nr:Lrp/AsnC family transcriptional regulator [Alphaproteobacteria bacterium]
MTGSPARDRRLLAAIQDGLPLVPTPYAVVAERVGETEVAVRDRLRDLIESGVIRRFGMVLRHHELGYRANAMAVWDVPDARVDAVGERMASLPYVTLCYRRPRVWPAWPYNLFCMIHGRDRETVRGQVAEAAKAAGIEGLRSEVLFSLRRFKQQGARFDIAGDRAA